MIKLNLTHLFSVSAEGETTTVTRISITEVHVTTLFVASATGAVTMATQFTTTLVEIQEVEDV
jgi:hypothetical protein